MKKNIIYTILIIIFIILVLLLCWKYYKEKETNMDISNNNYKESIEKETKDNKLEENNDNISNKEIEDSSNKTDNKSSDKIIVKENDKVTQKEKIVIIDESNNDACASAIEYYYEDSDYKYYFTCIKSGKVFVIINEKKYNIKDALNNNIVTIEELETAGFNPLKEEKKLQKY